MLIYSQILNNDNDITGFMLQPAGVNRETLIFLFEYVEFAQNGLASFSFITPMLILKINSPKTKKELRIHVPNDYHSFLKLLVSTPQTLLLKVLKEPFSIIYIIEPR